MSCGDPHDVNCAEALDRMIFFIDNELEQADLAQIQQHLEDCAPCLGEFDVERRVKEIVARSCSEHAPESLREKVVLHLREVQVSLRAGEPLD
jgi:mycothiol system anti-sigma-R factor